MTDDQMAITPSTKVAALLDSYPQLEDVLIGIAPPFKKLKNPILRRSVAKVASLRQAAAVGGLPVDELVNKLRAAVGQEALEGIEVGDSYSTEQPDWFDRDKIRESIDEQLSNPNEMALVSVIKAGSGLEQGEILELITTFIPAPGIDIMKRKGYLAWSEKEEGGLVRTYFSKPGQEGG